MKKVISAVTACFVSSFLFLTGCSDPDAELKSKVPDSVDAAAFVDGVKMVKNKAVSKAINDAAEELKDEKISIADLENRYLFFGSVKRNSARLAIKHQFATAIRRIALRMVLFGANGIALQLFFAFDIVGTQKSVLIQCRREKDLAHNFDNVTKERLSLGGIFG